MPNAFAVPARPRQGRVVVRGHVFDFDAEINCWMNLGGRTVQIFPPNDHRKHWIIFERNTRWRVTLSEDAVFNHAADVLDSIQMYAEKIFQEDLMVD